MPNTNNRGGKVSRTVDLFLDSDQPLDLFASQLAELTGHQFVPSPDGTHFAMHAGEVTAYLTEHDFLDDEGLPLGEFRYVLSAPIRSAGNIEESTETTCLRSVNTLFRSRGTTPSLLVLDLDRPDSRQVTP
jgi:hypothetical protein